MKKLIIVAALCAVAGGCRVVEVENRGEAVARDADGKPILVDGKVQIVNLGWSVYHNQHWMSTRADSLTANVKDKEIAFALNGMNSEPSEQLGVVIDKSLSGVALLAQKIGAAIASGGGSVASDAAAGAIAETMGKFIGKGGDPEKAKVSCVDGNCTITDDSISVSCQDCVNQ